jgi:hypothetical protein
MRRIATNSQQQQFTVKEENRAMKPPMFWPLGIISIVGFLSGCGGSDNVPLTAPPGAPIASADDQREPQSDALTSEEAALISQADAEPDPAPKADL